MPLAHHRLALGHVAGSCRKVSNGNDSRSHHIIMRASLENVEKSANRAMRFQQNREEISDETKCARLLHTVNDDRRCVRGNRYAVSSSVCALACRMREREKLQNAHQADHIFAAIILSSIRLTHARKS